MLTKITDATIEPVTVSEAKSHLRIDAATEDAYLASLITAARVDAENRMQRTLIDTTYRVTLDRFPAEIELPKPPTLVVVDVRYTDPDGIEQVMDAADYFLDNVREPGWLVPAVGDEWPQTREQINAVRVTYRAGYRASGTDAEKRAAVPMPIRQWILLAVGRMYEFREAAVQGQPVHSMEFADRLLDTYRVFTA
jgi:uncharacterized phiE125 gp8 family phage protein